MIPHILLARCLKTSTDTGISRNARHYLVVSVGQRLGIFMLFFLIKQQPPHHPMYSA
jgi:hypothetical protein